MVPVQHGRDVHIHDVPRLELPGVRDAVADDLRGWANWQGCYSKGLPGVAGGVIPAGRQANRAQWQCFYSLGLPVPQMDSS